MKLVIDIPEEDYNEIEPFLNGEKIKGCFNLYGVLEIIINGTQLPKWHGRLIDETKITRCGFDFIDNHFITNAPTIIDADKAESEEV